MKFIAIAAVVLLASCATGSHVLVGTKRAPIDPAVVRIYLAPPPGAEEVAILETNSASAFAITDQGKMDAAVDRLKKEAASLGANGVVLRGTGESTSGGAIVSTGPTTSIYASGLHKTAAGIAIYVPER